MHLTDSVIVEFLFIALLFGPLPVSFVVYHDEREVVVAFVLAFTVVYGLLGAMGHFWPLFILLPIAWYFALKPLIKMRSS